MKRLVNSIYTVIGLALLMFMGVHHAGAEDHRASDGNLEGDTLLF